MDRSSKKMIRAAFGEFADEVVVSDSTFIRFYFERLSEKALRVETSFRFHRGCPVCRRAMDDHADGYRDVSRPREADIQMIPFTTRRPDAMATLGR
jgi:hypothetical protein